MDVSAQTHTGLPCWYCGAFLLVELALGIYKNSCLEFAKISKKSGTTFIGYVEL